MTQKFKILFFTLCLASTAHAAEAPPVKLPPSVIAIIDMQRILQESLPAQSVQKQLDAQRVKFQTEIEGEENELRQAEDDLSKQRDKLPAQDYADHEQQLRQRFAVVENHVQERHKLLDQSFTESMNTVRAALLDVVEKVAHEHGANLVVIKQETLWTDQPLDITDEVLRRIDQKLPQVGVAMPADGLDSGDAPAKKR